ncbi:hypothetical protein F4556_003410 [Kitasatospora gansuensis]|uniref:DUF2637 domain-containing protein n=1 Tax=Kitasatospora gansuensis TaxID=258050 RepID=A0A7W7SCC2_9ACTN|nr:DUF2637 domain-containing protein [Kitasatospora gansuensis]MBB4947875.1 hypothetical protein [Kitasatospora gansuensis]
MTADQIRSAERALTAGTWTITFGAVLYSVLTVTPLMRVHSPEGWEWTAPILPLVVDAAVVIVVRMDAILARLGGQGGRWPVVLRWLTGAMTLLLNVGLSALERDGVGVAVHAVAPLLLIVTAEASLAYRRAIGTALAGREAGERAERAERERVAEEKRLRERAERLAEFEATERRERERREHEAALLREQREHEQQLLLADRAERERLEAAERAESERREHEVSEREQLEREHLARLRHELLSAEPAADRVSEMEARMIVRVAIATEIPQRRVVEVTGWSAGWVAARFQELRSGEHAPVALAVGMALR